MASSFTRTSALLFAVAAGLVAPRACADQEPTVKWNDEQWRRTGVAEGIVDVGLVGSIFVIDALPYRTHAIWTGPILFDDPVRNTLKGNGPVGHTASTTSDVLFISMVAEPFIVDDLVVALAVHRSPDVALQMTLIDMQSFGLAGVLTLGSEHLFSRSRPPFSDCGTANAGAQCSSGDDFRSFYAGHAAAAFTSAGLTCAHHEFLPLWGGGAPDALACGSMLALATTTSVLRIVADRHWASDVIVGVAVGAASGYLLPALSHYRLGQGKRTTVMQTSWGYIAPVPEVFDRGGGLGVAGIF